MFGQPAVPSILAAAVDVGGFVLDVREPGEWLAGHIEGSVHIPMNDVPARVSELPSDAPIVVACRVGGRSAQVTNWLRQQGFDATNLEGGLLEWAAAGRPLITNDGATGFVA